jgi:hypothetical protein
MTIQAAPAFCAAVGSRRPSRGSNTVRLGRLNLSAALVVEVVSPGDETCDIERSGLIDSVRASWLSRSTGQSRRRARSPRWRLWIGKLSPGRRIGRAPRSGPVCRCAVPARQRFHVRMTILEIDGSGQVPAQDLAE